MSVDRMCNLDAEAAVIGSVLMNNDSICEVIELLEPEDFYSEKHKIIYKSIKEMYESSAPIDIITLAEKLGKRLVEAGGVSYLSGIFNYNTILSNVKKYGEIIKEKSNYRQLLKIFTVSMEKLKNGDELTENLIDETQDNILGIKTCESGDSGNITEIMGDFLDTLQRRYEKGGDIQGMKSGYKSLDKVLGGFLKEDLIILAARPSMGKTAMALNLLLNCVFQENAKAAFFNLEMGKIQIIDRAISLHTSIPMKNIKTASLSDEEWLSITKASAKLADAPIKIYDKIFTLNGIKAECRKLKIKQGLDIVVIDYLQLMDSGQKSENRAQDISRITRKLKLMAKEFDITLILLSQLSRAPEARNDHRPMLSDLRESGSIEQDADSVVFLYRDEYYNRDSESKGIIECIVAKNRNGQVGTIRLKWKPEVQKVV